jgi:peroxiredoxin
MVPHLILLLAAPACGAGADPTPPAPPAIGARVANFTAKGADGQAHSLKEYASKKAIVIVVIGTECPVSNLHIVTLAEMQRKYGDKGLQFLAINSNDYDTFDEVVAHAKERKIPFPVLKDEDHSAVDAIGARRTPEAFLLDSDQVIRYHGRVDDQYGLRYRRAAPTKTELKDAIEELLAGKPITVPESDASQGCLIGRSKKGTKPPAR